MDAQTEALVKQFNALAGAIDKSHATVLAVLAALPVRMLLPATPDARSLSRAWEMAGEEPLLPMTIAHVRSMITCYFTAWEVACICNLSGAAPARLRIIEDALTRLDEHATAILRHVDGDFRAERLTDNAVKDIARLYGHHTREMRRRKR